MMIVLLTASLLCTAFAHAKTPISDIVITGLNKFSKATVLSYSGLEQGKSYSQEELDQAVVELYKTGLFTDVSVKLDDGKCIINVVESPTVYKVSFEGNFTIKDDELRTDLLMRERSLFSPKKLKKDVEIITNLYHKKGRYGVVIKPKVVNEDNGRIKLVYEINEGVTSKIGKITFVGNESFGYSKLESVIASKPSSIFRIFSSEDLFDQEKMEYDKEALIRFYMEHGYADFEIKSVFAEISKDKKTFNLVYAFNEGPKYKFGKLNIVSHVTEISQDELRKLCNIKEGATFNAIALSEIMDVVTEYMGEHGYAFVNVDYSLDKDTVNNIAHVTVNISPTKKMYINKINIVGNTRTQDGVIRRELRVLEASPYSAPKIRRSEQRVKNLGFFKDVSFENVLSSDVETKDYLDLNIKVKEMPTGGINFGIAYNTDDGPMGMVSYSEKNFLGTGREVELAGSKAKRSIEGNFRFTDPYFMNKPIAVGFEIFSTAKNRIKESSYKYKVTGFGVHSGYSISEYFTHRVRYSIKRENIYDVSANASQFIATQAGKFDMSSIGQTFVYDKLDDYMSPKDGYMIRLDQELAGLGGDVHYLRNKLYATYYKPVYKKNVILNLRANGGIIRPWQNDTIRVADRFFIGGDEIRGFNYGGIGPRDKVTKDALGGTQYYIATAELQFPIQFIESVNLTGAAFVDLGSLSGLKLKNQNPNDIFYDNALHASYGVGVIWNAGILGTKIRLDYGIPIKKQSYDIKKNVRFFIGYEP